MSIPRVIDVQPPYAPAQKVSITIDQYEIAFAKNGHEMRVISLIRNDISVLSGNVTMPKNLYIKALRCAYAVFKSTAQKYPPSPNDPPNNPT